MDATLPILILAIPLGMFLVLGLAGYKMSHKLAGTLGCLGMGTTLVLAYVTAFTYFFSGSPEFVDAAGNRLQSLVSTIHGSHSPTNSSSSSDSCLTRFRP